MTNSKEKLSILSTYGSVSYTPDCDDMDMIMLINENDSPILISIHEDYDSVIGDLYDKLHFKLHETVKTIEL